MVPAAEIIGFLKNSAKPVDVRIFQGVFTVDTPLEWCKGNSTFCVPTKVVAGLEGKGPQLVQFHFPEDQINSIKFDRSTTGDFLVEITLDTYPPRR